MADYTPSEGDIALGYAERAERICGTGHFAAMAEFDRWLAEVRRVAAEKALLEAATDLVRDDLTADRWYAEWLRDWTAMRYGKETNND